LASASSSRRDRRRNRTARLLQRSRWQEHRSLLGLEPVDHVAARQSMGRIWSACAHTRSGRSFRIHSENTRCATAVRRRGRPRFPVSEISRHSGCAPACAICCTGRTPPVGIVQHGGSAKPRTHPRRRRFKRRGPQTCAEDLGCLCSDSESWIQATLAGDIGGLHKAGAGVVRVTCIITPLSPWSRTGSIRSSWRSRAGFVNRRHYRSEDRGPKMPGTASQAVDA
jgi:hypothetical protein